MPLDPRSISIRIAVLCLFAVSFVGWFSGLAPLTCCKKALIGAFVVYFITGIIVDILNQILISAFVQSRIEAQKKEMSGREH
jgi:uncharacterized membrane protein YjjP (DUF1212 family)